MWKRTVIFGHVNQCQKSCCIRIGQHFSVKCKDISSLNGQTLPWVKELKYLGVYFIQARSFCCSLDHAKRSFYRAANSRPIFGKIGRIASEEVTLQLKSKCIPVLLYGLEARPLNKSRLRHLIFTVRRYALHGICDSNSVCPSVRPSVRPSVCLSHSWTVSTWFDLRSWFLHHMVAPSF